jgi:hypothetical protein
VEYLLRLVYIERVEASVAAMSNLNASNNDVDNLPDNLNTALGLNSSSPRDHSETEQKSNNQNKAMEMQVDVDGTSTNDRAHSDNNTVDLPEASANCESTEQKKAGKQDVEVDAIASGTVSPDDLSISVPVNEGKSDVKTTDGAEAKTSIYQVKWTRFGNKSVPIITQNENGPCPLLAIANCLTLRHQLKLQPGTDFVLAEQLVQLVCELLLENIPRVRMCFMNSVCFARLSCACMRFLTQNVYTFYCRISMR